MCTLCGFCRLRLYGLRKSLVINDTTIIHEISIASPIIAGNEWSISGIVQSYYTSIAKPIVASHAKDVTRQAAVALTTVGDVGDGDYKESSSARTLTLCLATKRGTLVDFLDQFEASSEKHADHRNLVSTERLAQVRHDQNVRPLIVKRNIDFSENGTIKHKWQISHSTGQQSDTLYSFPF